MLAHSMAIGQESRLYERLFASRSNCCCHGSPRAELQAVHGRLEEFPYVQE